MRPAVAAVPAVVVKVAAAAVAEAGAADVDAADAAASADRAAAAADAFCGNSYSAFSTARRRALAYLTLARLRSYLIVDHK